MAEEMESYDIEIDTEDNDVSSKEVLDKLMRWLPMENIADEIEQDTLDDISRLVMDEFKVDDRSRSEWKEELKMALRLTSFIKTEKNFPWNRASNVKYPMVTKAALQFASRAYPQLIQSGRVVKIDVVGDDPDNQKAERAERVSEHMNYQIFNEMHGWEEDFDKMLMSLSIIGDVFKKTYFDPELGLNVSDYVPAEYCVVNNNHMGSIESAPRVTHIYSLTPNEIVERQRSKVFLDSEIGTPSITIDQIAIEGEYSSNATDGDDEDMAHVFLEQHRWYDLDGDGYKEPYIVTVHYDTGKTVRIVARYEQDGVKINADGEVSKIIPVQYFTHFVFIPSVNNTFYNIGFGILLGHLNDSINTLFNQLIDSGTIQNTQGGFITEGVNIKKSAGDLEVRMGEWTRVNIQGGKIQDNMMLYPKSQPSAVLFQMLGMTIEAAEGLASVSDLLSGGQPPANQPATTTIALIEQGLKVFGGIYKRTYRALTSEYKKLYRLNSIYLEEENYYNVVDGQKAIARADYDEQDCDVVPVGDPNNVDDGLMLVKAEAMMALLGKGLNDIAIITFYLEALKVPNIDKFLPDETEQQEEPPDPKILIEQEKLAMEREKLPYENEKLKQEAQKLQAETISTAVDTEIKRAGASIEAAGGGRYGDPAERYAINEPSPAVFDEEDTFLD